MPNRPPPPPAGGPPPHLGGPPPPPGHGPQWIENEQRWRSPSEAGQRIVEVAEKIAARGSVKFGNSEITPADPSLCTIRYESHHNGELTLKFEIKWSGVVTGGVPQTGDQDLPVE